MGWSLFLARCSRSACYRVSQPFLGSLEHNASPCFCLIQQNLSYLCPRFPPLAAVVPSWGYWANNSQELLVPRVKLPHITMLKRPLLWAEYRYNMGTMGVWGQWLDFLYYPSSLFCISWPRPFSFVGVCFSLISLSLLGENMAGKMVWNCFLKLLWQNCP